MQTRTDRDQCILSFTSSLSLSLSVYLEPEIVIKGYIYNRIDQNFNRMYYSQWKSQHQFLNCTCEIKEKRWVFFSSSFFFFFFVITKARDRVSHDESSEFAVVSLNATKPLNSWVGISSVVVNRQLTFSHLLYVRVYISIEHRSANSFVTAFLSRGKGVCDHFLHDKQSTTRDKSREFDLS